MSDTTPAQPCNCIYLINDSMEKQGRNERLNRPLFGNGNGPCSVETYLPPGIKRKRGQSGLTIWATYCPFCGQKYPDGEATR